MKIVLFAGFVIGIAASLLLTVFLLGGAAYVFWGVYPGVVAAETPLWVFSLVPLVLLYRTKLVREACLNIVGVIESWARIKAQQEKEKKTPPKWWETR